MAMQHPVIAKLDVALTKCAHAAATHRSVRRIVLPLLLS